MKSAGKSYLRGVIILIGISVCALIFVLIWRRREENKKSIIHLGQYPYARELEGSPCVSPDGKNVLHVIVVYNSPISLKGYVLGFVYSNDTYETKWIYSQKCSNPGFVESFNSYYDFDFYWENGINVIIDTGVKNDKDIITDVHVIDIFLENTYWFDEKDIIEGGL